MSGSPASLTTSANRCTDTVVRSQSGRILRNALNDWLVSETWDYTFDAAGSLTQAVLDDGNPVTPAEHILTYGFASTGSCGVNTRAGMNGNRTRFTDVKEGTLVTDVAYCYDWADRLTGSVPSGAVPSIPGVNPVLGTALSTTGSSPTLAYDSHGNTTVLTDQLMS